MITATEYLRWIDVQNTSSQELSRKIANDPTRCIISLMQELLASSNLPPGSDRLTINKFLKAIKELPIRETLVERMRDVFLKAHVHDEGLNNFLRGKKMTKATIEEILKEDGDPGEVLILLKRGERLPRQSRFLEKYLVAMCQCFNRGDKQLLYPLIRDAIVALIKKDRSLDVFGSTKRTFFSDLLENGGNVAELFNPLPKEVVKEAENQKLVVRSMLQSNSLTYTILGLQIPGIRSRWFAYDTLNFGPKYLNFLQGPVMTAFAQIIDRDWSRKQKTSDFDLLWNIGRLPFAQQQDFLSALSPGTKQEIAKQYIEYCDSFSLEREQIYNILQEIWDDLRLEEKDSLKSLADDYKVKESNKKAKLSDPGIESRVAQLKQIIDYMNLWHESPRLREISLCLGKLLKNRMGGKERAAKFIVRPTKEEKEEQLKYQILENHLKEIIPIKGLAKHDLDIKKLFEEVFMQEQDFIKAAHEYFKNIKTLSDLTEKLKTRKRKTQDFALSGGQSPSILGKKRLLNGNRAN